jgi:hypothetical protein
MYEKPILERFGSLRQLTAAPLVAVGTPMSLVSGSMSAAGGCGPNIPIGDPSACGRS